MIQILKNYLKYKSGFYIIKSVIKMNDLSKLIVKKIIRTTTVVYDSPVCIEMKDRDCYGFSLAKSGKIIYTQNGKQFVSDPEHMIFLPMHGSYSLECTEPGSFTLINFLCPEDFKISEFIRIKVKNAEQLINEHNILEGMDLYGHGERQPEFLSVFYRMLSGILKNAENKNPLIKKIYRYIEDNVDDSSLSNSKIAKAAGISEVYLRKLFQSNSNTSPRQYIQQIRLHKAKSLLASCGLSVAEVAEECGYSSVYHFCRMFRQKTGFTPTEYRNKFKIFL